MKKVLIIATITVSNFAFANHIDNVITLELCKSNIAWYSSSVSKKSAEYDLLNKAFNRIDRFQVVEGLQASYEAQRSADRSSIKLSYNDLKKAAGNCMLLASTLPAY